jgi:hypothetical protein
MRRVSRPFEPTDAPRPIRLVNDILRLKAITQCDVDLVTWQQSLPDHVDEWLGGLPYDRLAEPAVTCP